MRLLFTVCVAVFCLSSSCTRKDRISQSPLPNLNVVDRDFCSDLVQVCPKLARLAYAHTPEPSGNNGYFIYPELLSYLLDSIKTERMYYNKLDKFCQGVTREQIVCAIGEPGKS